MTPLVIALALAVSDRPATDFYGDTFAAFVPTDVRLFVIDAQACTHFSGEPYEDQDKERKAFLEKVVAKTCNNIEKRKARLERGYVRSAKVKKVIWDAWKE